jgi:cytochrome c
MTFAGLGNPQDRADVIAFLNQHSDAPKPLPAAPAAAAANGATGEKAAGNPPGNGPNNGPQTAGKEPVLNQQQAGANPKNVGGEAAPKKPGG